MSKIDDEYNNLLDEIDMEMSFDIDYFTSASKKEKEGMENELDEIATELTEKVNASSLSNKLKTELIELIDSKLEFPEIA